MYPPFTDGDEGNVMAAAKKRECISGNWRVVHIFGDLCIAEILMGAFFCVPEEDSWIKGVWKLQKEGVF